MWDRREKRSDQLASITYRSNLDHVLEQDEVVEIRRRVVGEIDAIVAHEEQAELVLAERRFAALVVLHTRLLLVHVEDGARRLAATAATPGLIVLAARVADVALALLLTARFGRVTRQKGLEARVYAMRRLGSLRLHRVEDEATSYSLPVLLSSCVALFNVAPIVSRSTNAVCCQCRT